MMVENGRGKKGTMMMDKPVLNRFDIAAELPRGQNNPRNSEGDFAQLKDGSILFAYSRYHGDDADDDAACDVAGMLSRDGGKSFAPLPERLATAAELNTRNIMSVSLCRIPDGTLCLFYLAKFGPQSAVYLKRATEENGLSFGPPELCVPKKRNVYYVINNARVTISPRGEVLLPLARHAISGERGRRHGVYFGTACVFAGDGHGRNWYQKSKVLSMPDPGYSRTGLQEPGIEVLPDGRLYGYFRTDRHFQYESFSGDGGAGWTKPLPSRFTSPDSPMLIRRNPFSGIYYALWNPIPNYNGRIDPSRRWIAAGRTPFVLAQSEDGVNFSDYTVLEDDPEKGYCYPALYFLDEKTFLLSYCCGGEEDGMCLTRTRIRRGELALPEKD